MEKFVFTSCTKVSRCQAFHENCPYGRNGTPTEQSIKHDGGNLRNCYDGEIKVEEVKEQTPFRSTFNPTSLIP